MIFISSFAQSCRKNTKVYEYFSNAMYISLQETTKNGKSRDRLTNGESELLRVIGDPRRPGTGQNTVVVGATREPHDSRLLRRETVDTRSRSSTTRIASRIPNASL